MRKHLQRVVIPRTKNINEVDIAWYKELKVWRVVEPIGITLENEDKEVLLQMMVKLAQDNMGDEDDIICMDVYRVEDRR